MGAPANPDLTSVPEPTSIARTSVSTDELVAYFAMLPVYAGSIVNQSGAAQGSDRVGGAFWTKDRPEAVIEFYQKELDSSGWTSTGPAKRLNSTPKLDGTTTSGISEVFTKPGSSSSCPPA